MSSFKLYNQVTPQTPNEGETVFWPDVNGNLKYMGSDGVPRDFSTTFGTSYASVSLPSPVSVSQDWFETILSKDLPSVQTGLYRVSLSGVCKLSDVISDLRLALFKNGTQVGQEIRFEPKDKSVEQRIPISSFKLVNLKANDKLEVRACTEDWSQTLDIYELYMDLWRVG